MKNLLKKRQRQEILGRGLIMFSFEREFDNCTITAEDLAENLPTKYKPDLSGHFNLAVKKKKLLADIEKDGKNIPEDAVLDLIFQGHSDKGKRHLASVDSSTLRDRDIVQLDELAQLIDCCCNNYPKINKITISGCYFGYSNLIDQKNDTDDKANLLVNTTDKFKKFKNGNLYKLWELLSPNTTEKIINHKIKIDAPFNCYWVFKSKENDHLNTNTSILVTKEESCFDLKNPKSGGVVPENIFIKDLKKFDKEKIKSANIQNAKEEGYARMTKLRLTEYQKLGGKSLKNTSEHDY